MATLAFTGVLSAQSMQLGSVKLGSSVMADGKPLAAGTYSLRVSADVPAPVVGQSPDETRWVEFVQGGEVKGREIATVLTPEKLKARGDAPIAAGSSKVQMLKGDEYVRVWVNRDGKNYLIHLAMK
jgi:hypothetical protein